MGADDWVFQCASPTAKAKERAELETDMKEFLAGGGRVTEIRRGVLAAPDAAGKQLKNTVALNHKRCERPLNKFQMDALAACETLGADGKPIRVCEIAKKLNLTHGTVYSRLQTLERRKYVRRNDGFFYLVKHEKDSV